MWAQDPELQNILWLSYDKIYLKDYRKTVLMNNDTVS